MSDQTEYQERQQDPAAPSGGTDERPKVKFLGKPKIVVDPEGVSVRFVLLNRGKHSLGVNFRVSFNGRMLDIEAPQLSLKAGSAPTNVHLKLPLDTGIVEGSNINVAVVGPGGQTVAASSTGAVTVGLPGGGSVAITAKGVAVTGALTLGVVTLAVTQIIRPDPPSPVEPLPTPPEDVVFEDEPAIQEEPEEESEQPEELGPEQWPINVPSQLRAHSPPTAESIPLDEPLPYGTTEAIMVEFDRGPISSDGLQDVGVSVRLGDRTASVGTVVLPAELDASAGGNVLPIGEQLRSDVELFTDGASIDLSCLRRGGDRATIGGYRTVGERGTITVTFMAIPDSGAAFALGAEVSIESPISLHLNSKAIEGEDLSNCPEDPRAIVTWDSQLAENAGGPSQDDDEASQEEGSADDGVVIEDEESADDETVDDVESIGYVLEPDAGSLLLGHRGDRVAALQRALVDDGYLDEADADGSFGPSTQEAVRRLQGDEGLDVDGLAGPATHEALGLAYASLPGSATIAYVAEPATGALLEGHEGPRVRRLQEALVARGFLDGPIDGEFGPGTQDAVLRFQASVGLEVDGIAGPNTHRALGLSYP